MIPSPTRNGAPALSVILPTWDDFDALRTTVRHLTAQTVAGSIELIVCAPSAERAKVDDNAVRGLHSVRVLETGALHATGPMRAHAVREAKADVIVFAEDHCFPDPDWAQALLAAHAEPHAAVGPAVYNANPTPVSWADLYIEYGRWLAPGRRREVEMLPGHNASYKRAVLLTYGSELDRLMEAETVLYWDLRRKGHTLLFEPSARAAHTNFTRFDVFLNVQWHLGRVFGATRAAHWPLLRRAAFALASPAIPLIRLNHVLQSVIANRCPVRPLITATPIMLAGLAVDWVAQATGVLFGGAGSLAKLSAYEFHRNEVNRTGHAPH